MQENNIYSTKPYDKNSITLKIYVTNGMGRCGKDTFAGFIDDYVIKQTDRRQGFNKLSSVDVAKDLAEYHGVNRDDKSDKARKFHSDLLRAMEAYDNSPLQSVIDNIKNLNWYEHQLYFTVDIREPYRIDKFKAMCMAQLPNSRVYTVYIDRPNITQVTTNEGDASTLEEYQYNFTCHNNGDLEHWKKVSEDFARCFVLKNVNT